MTQWHVEGLRYAIVGLASNVTLYLLYLGLTTAGLGHKTAMTVVYVVGTLQTFIFNKRWTFAHQGRVSASLRRYLAAYGGCYLLNLALLYLLVDILHLPHAPVQGLAIVGLAILLFLLQKFWVFRPASRSSAIPRMGVFWPRRPTGSSQ